MKMQPTNSAVPDLAQTQSAQIVFNAPSFGRDSRVDADNSAFQYYDEITRLKLDYRIALVPLTAQQHMSATRQNPNPVGADLLILPYTWKEFVTHVRREA